MKARRRSALFYAVVVVNYTCSVLSASPTAACETHPHPVDHNKQSPPSGTQINTGEQRRKPTTLSSQAKRLLLCVDITGGNMKQLLKPNRDGGADFRQQLLSFNFTRMREEGGRFLCLQSCTKRLILNAVFCTWKQTQYIYKSSRTHQHALPSTRAPPPPLSPYSPQLSLSGEAIFVGGCHSHGHLHHRDVFLILHRVLLYYCHHCCYRYFFYYYF